MRYEQQKAVFYAFAVEHDAYIVGCHGELAKAELVHGYGCVSDTLIPAPPPGGGVWVWEGLGELDYCDGYEYANETEPEYQGEWRRAHLFEVTALARGETPEMREFDREWEYPGAHWGDD